MLVQWNCKESWHGATLSAERDLMVLSVSDEIIMCMYVPGFQVQYLVEALV